MLRGINVEIKAKCQTPQIVRDILIANEARYEGLDQQKDTYFNCNNGRLKLREGNIENALIFYQRENLSGPKLSNVVVTPINKNSNLRELLSMAYGVFIEVNKKREIYYIENIKFHLDEITNLGTFVEIEAFDRSGTYSKEQLEQQCKHYLDLFNIHPDDLITHSYSDLLKT
jgi:adenylate cyclase, class 2